MSNAVLYNFSKTVFSVSSGSLKSVNADKYVQLDYSNPDKTSVLKFNEVNYFPISLSLVKKSTQYYCVAKTADNVDQPKKYLYLIVPIQYDADAKDNDLDLALNSISSTLVNGVLVDLNSWLKPADTNSNTHKLFVSNSSTSILMLSTTLKLKSMLIDGTNSPTNPEINNIPSDLNAIVPPVGNSRGVSFKYQPLTTIMDCQPTTGADKNDVSFAKSETLTDKDVMNKIITTFIILILVVVGVASQFNTIYFHTMVKLANVLKSSPTKELTKMDKITDTDFPLKAVNLYWSFSLGLMALMMIIFGSKFDQGDMVTAGMALIVGAVSIGYLYSKNQMFLDMSATSGIGDLFKGSGKYLFGSLVLFFLTIIIPMIVFLSYPKKTVHKTLKKFIAVVVIGFVYLFCSHVVLQNVLPKFEATGIPVVVSAALILLVLIIVMSLFGEGII